MYYIFFVLLQKFRFLVTSDLSEYFNVVFTIIRFYTVSLFSASVYSTVCMYLCTCSMHMHICSIFRVDVDNVQRANCIF